MGQSFESAGRIGNPDLTISTPGILHLISEWMVLDTETNSDHKFIIFTLGEEQFVNSEFYLKTRYPIGKFIHNYKKLSTYFKNKLNLISNTQDLNDLYNEYLKTVQTPAIKNIRKKKKSQQG